MEKYHINFNIDDWNEQELCNIYHHFNCCEWPIILGDKPSWWPVIIMHHDKNTMESLSAKWHAICLVAESICNKIGGKELLRYYWLNSLREPNEEFEEWYVNKDNGEWLNDYYSKKRINI